jgi:hypothetical protein
VPGIMPVGMQNLLHSGESELSELVKVFDQFLRSDAYRGDASDG